MGWLHVLHAGGPCSFPGNAWFIEQFTYTVYMNRGQFADGIGYTHEVF